MKTEYQALLESNSIFLDDSALDHFENRVIFDKKALNNGRKSKEISPKLKKYYNMDHFVSQQRALGIENVLLAQRNKTAKKIGSKIKHDKNGMNAVKFCLNEFKNESAVQKRVDFFKKLLGYCNTIPDYAYVKSKINLEKRKMSFLLAYQKELAEESNTGDAGYQEIKNLSNILNKGLNPIIDICNKKIN